MKKSLLHVMYANIICLVINLLNNFIIPKYVSIESYSMIKTYALYMTYAGFFSMGYNDGMYLKYGGKDLKSVNKKGLADNFINYLILMFLMLLFVFFVGILIEDCIIIAFSFGMFAYNILGYLKSLYQATGEFKAYGKALNIEKIMVFIFSMCLIFIIHSDNYLLFIWVQVIVGLIIAFYLFYKLERKLQFIRLGKVKKSEYKDNITSGIVLMLGNFSSSVFTGLDRWFVKMLLMSTDFAMYSFAVSMENVINVFISSITVSMYNYFCKGPSTEDIKKIKNITLVWGFLVIAAAFPAKWILENYLKNYIDSSSVVFILFAAQVFYVIVKGIYVNVYKAEKKQSLYLKQMILMIICGTILNAFFFYLFRNMVCIAAATLATAIIWMYMCEIKNQYLRFGFKENLSIFIITFVYLYCGYKLESITGLILYFLTLMFVCLIFMKETYYSILQYCKMLLCSLKRKSE